MFPFYIEHVGSRNWKHNRNNFMLSILCFKSWKKSINFEWVQHTGWKIMQMNFPLIFHFLFSAVGSCWMASECRRVCELAEECQTTKNYQPRKQFRWVNQHIFQHVKVTVGMSCLIRETFYEAKVETGVVVGLSACLTRGLTKFLLLFTFKIPLGNTNIDSAKRKQKFVLFLNDFLVLSATRFSFLCCSRKVMNFWRKRFPFAQFQIAL